MPQFVDFCSKTALFFPFFLQKMLFYLYLRKENKNIFYSHNLFFKNLHYEQD